MDTHIKKKQIRDFTYSISIGLVFATLIAALTMFIAWEHNSQSEIQNEFGINWLYFFKDDR
jgi:hypothetical protein